MYGVVACTCSNTFLAESSIQLYAAADTRIVGVYMTLYTNTIANKQALIPNCQSHVSVCMFTNAIPVLQIVSSWTARCVPLSGIRCLIIFPMVASRQPFRLLPTLMLAYSNSSPKHSTPALNVPIRASHIVDTGPPAYLSHAPIHAARAIPVQQKRYACETCTRCGGIGCGGIGCGGIGPGMFE